jgi:hypothetical protein
MAFAIKLPLKNSTIRIPESSYSPADFIALTTDYTEFFPPSDPLWGFMRKPSRKQSALSTRRTQSQPTAQIAAESPKLHLRIREALRRASGVVARRRFAVRTTPAFSRAEGRRPEGVGWNALLDSILSTASAQGFVGTSLACANLCGSSITTKEFSEIEGEVRT